MADLKKGFDKFHTITQNSWDKLQQILIEKSVKKDEIFCLEGQYYENEFMISSGVVRGYYQTFHGQDINVSFLRKGDIAIPLFHRNIERKSLINFQALEDSVIYEFNANAFSQLMREHPDLGNFGEKFVAYQLKQKTIKEIYLLSKSAEDRILYFRQTYPNLENEIPHYHIASFLGITPISLSRLRKKIAKSS